VLTASVLTVSVLTFSVLTASVLTASVLTASVLTVSVLTASVLTVSVLTVSVLTVSVHGLGAHGLKQDYMIRLFIAMNTPHEILPLLAGVRDRLKATRADVKWDSNEKLHCTLKFLGNTHEELLPDIISALGRVASLIPPFPVIYSGLGCFPDKQEPQIIWVGVEDLNGVLQKLAQTVGTHMAALGFEREQRPFHPHVTLGRVKSPRHLRELLAMMETVTFHGSPVSLGKIELVKSELKPGGSVYTVVTKAILALSPEP
jgi:2'-5' RNA ligase